MSDNNQAEQENTTASHNFSQADYDEAKARARRFEGKVADLEKKLDTYSKLGDPLDLQGKLRHYDELSTKTLAEVKDPEEFKETINRKIDEARKPLMSELEKTKQQAEKLAKELHSIKVVDRAVDSISKYFAPDTLPVVKELYLNKYIDKDEKGEFVVLDDEKLPRVNGSKNMGLEDFAEEILKKHPSFRSSTPSNNSRPAGSASSATVSKGSLESLLVGISDPEQRKEIIRKHKFPNFKK